MTCRTATEHMESQVAKVDLGTGVVSCWEEVARIAVAPRVMLQVESTASATGTAAVIVP